MQVQISKELSLKDLKCSLDKSDIVYEITQNDEAIIVSFDDIDYMDFIKLIDNKYIQIISYPYNLKLVTRVDKLEDSVIECGNVTIGSHNKVIIAGPCAIEDYDSCLRIAKHLKQMGINVMRAGAYKPRTNPYSFQGLNKDGLNILKRVKKETNILIASEIVDVNDLDLFLDTVDFIQVGARNMQNFALLKALGKIDKPIILKRGFNNSIEEFLCAAEYILLGGNNKVILCERGIRTPLSYTRNSLDIGAIPTLKRLTHLPVIVDPSHATGKRSLVSNIGLSSLVAGADGLIIEAHFDPNNTISDSEETISLKELEKLLHKVSIVSNL